MTEAAEMFGVTRPALYVHAAWEGDHWTLVTTPAPRPHDGVTVSALPIAHARALPDTGRTAAAQEVRERMGQVLTVGEVAELFRVSPESVRDWIARGELDAYQLPSGAWRIEPDAVEALKRRRRGGRERHE
jgi:excisionase family DNA binding protein